MNPVKKQCLYKRRNGSTQKLIRSNNFNVSALSNHLLENYHEFEFSNFKILENENAFPKRLTFMLQSILKIVICT